MSRSQSGPLGRHRTLHGQVVEWLGRRIVSGELAHGSQLPNEADLAAQLNVSRGGVREAVKALAAKGLVEPRPRLGTRVLPREQWNLMDREVISWHGQLSDAAFLRDLLELRLMVEPGAAQLAAERATDEQLAVLESACARMAEEAGRVDADSAAFVEADLAFHLTLLRASGNQLVEQLGRLLEASLHHGLAASSHAPGGVAATLPLHQAVLVAVRARRPAAAARAMRKLIETTTDAVRRMTTEGD
ncbi:MULTISPECIES: FadR/GntR family transcriptional regulator [Amycolatopsis]|uniref:FCD domain-containing protein n=1 Tax=Amycolatopsis tucumanensis TaxID=401106 RepID=A0ABP7IR50_9PSEU|nr:MULTISPECIES: FadR/GntR family transcriptional regulator [Amycolatopsis]MCF6427605.1 FadR family transcriptional regulator [Amycolatopsis tucumanensis]